MKFVFSLLICFFVIGCTQQNRPNIQFYHWKSTVDFNETEVQLFKNLRSNKLYLRLFDVDTKNGIVEPIGAINKFDSQTLSADYIPVIFITNRTFTNTTPNKITILAEHVSILISRITSDTKIFNFEEIQIDCDWTATTKENYFLFLETLKKITNKNITCTLRLHQVKFKKTTGIPPVKKVYLMCYATSNPIQNDGENSILDLDLLKDYLQKINDYPISFDIALPIYSWAIVTNHLGKSKLINAVTQSDLSTVNFKKDNNNFTAIDDTFLKGFYVNKGFTIKVETISPELLNETKTFLKSKINQPYDIVYYHLDSIFTNRYSLKDLQ